MLSERMDVKTMSENSLLEYSLTLFQIEKLQDPHVCAEPQMTFFPLRLLLCLSRMWEIGKHNLI